MRTLASCLLAAALALCLDGCLSSPGGLAPSTLPITGKDSYVIVQQGVSGGEGSVGLCGIPLWTPNAYDSLQSVKSKYQADGLINVTVENKSCWPMLIPIVTYHSLVIKGDAIKFKHGDRAVRQ